MWRIVLLSVIPTAIEESRGKTLQLLNGFL
jgi:hypothetical protein